MFFCLIGGRPEWETKQLVLRRVSSSKSYVFRMAVSADSATDLQAAGHMGVHGEHTG